MFVTTFQCLALIGIFMIVASSLAVAWKVETSRRELQGSNSLLRDLLITMRDRL